MTLSLASNAVAIVLLVYRRTTWLVKPAEQDYCSCVGFRQAASSKPDIITMPTAAKATGLSYLALVDIA